MRERPLITLLTDFGTTDTYVGQVKGVIAGLCPSCNIVDLTHAVLPQQVEQAAFLLESAIGAFPTGTIHVAVVDPGVGSDRTALAVSSRGCFFVGPDNGLLSCGLPEQRRSSEAGTVTLPPGVEAVSLRPAARQAVSSTFHGRDLFAVAAARLAMGEPLRSLGSRVERMIALPPFRGQPLADGSVVGRVVHIDRFGTVVTTVHSRDLAGRRPVLHMAGVTVTAFVRTYAEGEGLVTLIGSGGYLEVALVNGDAAAQLGATLGLPVTATFADGSLS